MHATFSLLCIGKTRNALTNEEADSLHDLASIVLLPGWGLSREKASPVPRASVHTYLRPRDPGRPISPYKPDPAPLVDLIRRRNSPLAIDWCCRAVELPNTPNIARTCLGSLPLNNLSKPDTTFFLSCITDTEDDGLLSLQLFVHSPEPLDRGFLASSGHLALGRSTIPTPISRRNIFFRQQSRSGAIMTTPDVLLPLFHPPHGHMESRGLDSNDPVTISVKYDTTQVHGTTIGLANRQDRRYDVPSPLNLTDADRLKHIYVLGKTGSGKSNLLKTLVKQDIAAGKGLAVIDPHGDLADYALQHCGPRYADVTYLDFTDPVHVPMLNPLLLDADSPSGFYEVVENLIDIICHRSFNQWTGPVFEDTAQMMFDTLRSTFIRDRATPSIALGLRLLTASASERRVLATHLEEAHPALARQWANFNNMDAGDNAEVIRWVEAKFTPWSEAGALRVITSGMASPLSLDSVVQQRNILIAKLPQKTLGTAGAEIIGALIFSRLQKAAERHPDPDHPFYLYVDEFQRFVGLDLESLIAESRKLGFGMVLAHQNLRQLDGFSRHEGTSSARLREALFGNAGTLVCLKISGADIGPIAQELLLTERALRRIPQYGAVVRPVAGGIERDPASIAIPEAPPARGGARVAARIRRRMVLDNVWQARDRLEADLARDLQSIDQALGQPQRPGFPGPSPASDFTRQRDRATRRRRGASGDGDEVLSETDRDFADSVF